MADTTFADVQSVLGTPTTVKTPTAISASTQSMIDILSRAAESKARANAIRRGMEGSTTESLNIGRQTTEAAIPLMTSDLDRQATAYNTEAQLEATRKTALAGLTSDEVASLRAIADKTQDRDLQKYLGELGVSASQSAADKAEHAASVQAKSGVWSSLLSGAASGGVAAVVPF